MSNATAGLHDRPSRASLEFAQLESWLASAAAGQLPLNCIEAEQHSRGREVQRLLLQSHLDQRGDGDVGPILRISRPDGDRIYSHRRLRPRSITTIFGTVELMRMGYSRRGAPSIYPLDQLLALPARSFSYELQRRLVKAAVQNPFHESVDAIADLTAVSVPKRCLEHMVREAALDFDVFYQQRVPEPADPILVAAVDGKGIPMVKPGGAQPSGATHQGTEDQPQANGDRGRGIHASALGAHPRTGREACSVPTAGPTAAQPPPRPENKRVWASLTKAKIRAVIQEVAEEMQRRDPTASEPDWR